MQPVFPPSISHPTEENQDQSIKRSTCIDNQREFFVKGPKKPFHNSELEEFAGNKPYNWVYLNTHVTLRKGHYPTTQVSWRRGWLEYLFHILELFSETREEQGNWWSVCSALGQERKWEKENVFLWVSPLT